MITREDCIKVGGISKTHNLQGAVVISTDSNLLERYAKEPVFLQLDGAPVPFFISDAGITARNHTSYIVKFDFVDSLEQAERLLGSEVLLEKRWVEEEEEEKEESEFGVFDLVGFGVDDQISKKMGKVIDVADYSGNIVLTISILGKEILLPISEDYIIEVDIINKQLRTSIPIDLIELN